MELDLSQFELKDAIESAVTLVKERAQRSGIQLGVEVGAGLGEIRADERKVKQILVNLLSNAVKFTPSGGTVSVSAQRNGTSAEISVADTGPGIAAQDHAAVFEEFRQVGATPRARPRAPGSGCRCRSASRNCTAAASGSKVHPARAAHSRSTCRSHPLHEVRRDLGEPCVAHAPAARHVVVR
jgi:light-regulated signal transduction histidine kinase (bacteriophytochrome)